MYDLSVNGEVSNYEMRNLGVAGLNASIRPGRKAGLMNFTTVRASDLGVGSGHWATLITYGQRTWAFRYEGQGGLEVHYDPSTDQLEFFPRGGRVYELTDPPSEDSSVVSVERAASIAAAAEH